MLCWTRFTRWITYGSHYRGTVVSGEDSSVRIQQRIGFFDMTLAIDLEHPEGDAGRGSLPSSLEKEEWGRGDQL